MKKLLITGFEPFGGENINPSWEAVCRLPSEIDGYILTKLLLPVVFGKAAEAVIEAADNMHPDVILSVGQAGGRNAITPEMLGINLRHASIPDNQGNQPCDETIAIGGENALFSTIPVRKICEAVKDCGVAAAVSYSAGAYVCNDVLYSLLLHFKGSDTKVGFIHIPYSKEQNKEPSFDLGDIVDGLTAAIKALD